MLRANHKLPSAELDRRADRLEHALGHLHRLRRLGNRRDDDRELVSAQARRDVTGAERVLDA